MQRIVVIEDDPTIASAVVDRLRTEGFGAESLDDGRTGLARCLVDPPDLVVLDLMVPGLDGVEVCRRLRAMSAVPILMLTARDEEADQLIGLAVGADDYLTKLFSQRVLVARMRALLRRAEGHATPGDQPIALGAVRVDSRRPSGTGGRRRGTTYPDRVRPTCLLGSKRWHRDDA